MNRLAINNPKRLSDLDPKVNWYNYYAGFSNSFVKNALLSFNLDASSVVLDPWNGAGTTTTAAANEGFNSIGIDLNPAMNIVAKAKSATKAEIELAYFNLKNMRVNKFNASLNDDDFLLNWFSVDTAKYIRYISFYILKHKKVDVNNLDFTQCVMFLALFNVVRGRVKEFIPSNPTWIKKAKNEFEKIRVSNENIKKDLIEYLKSIKKDIPIEKLGRERMVSLICASSKKLPLSCKSIDLIITSPPYCTRIDYGVATYPELAVLLGDKPYLIDELRRELIGRTTIDKNLSPNNFISNESVRFMELVSEHISHASSNYYLKNFKQYFLDMQASISELSRVLKHGAHFVCVVQDSFYKEIYCDLSGIITEIALKNNLLLIDKKDFEVKINMANLHSGTKKYRSKVSATESVLIFKQS